MPFLTLTMPHPDDPDDATKSLYEITPQARLLCNIMEKVDRGELKRVAVSIGPQMGKSQIISRAAPAWMSGRNPRLNCILSSYNGDFAGEFGDDVRAIIKAPAFRQVFPDYQLRTGGGAKDLLISEAGGKLAFVGVGGSGTGKPADRFIVDDPIRNDDDAQSEIYRQRTWNWFNKVAMTRCHGNSSIVVVHTRWSEDDLIGRLCDPEHPERNKRYKGIADKWVYINIPAVVDDPKLAKALGLTLDPPTDPFVISMFGTKPMSSIWPSRKPLSFLAEAKQQDERAFESLNMGKPAPDDGEYFKANDLVLYHNMTELPQDLRYYGASDHATSEKKKNDGTVVGVVGVDSTDDVWVMPDLFWENVETDDTVEALISKFEKYHPALWWLESENISKSFGPFLIKRMHEKRIYTTIDPVTVSTDKKTRARSIQGRMRQRKVHFPAFAPWWPSARNELLKFPYATHDDFVDFLAHIGMGLLKEVGASPALPEGKVVNVGSMAWLLAQTKQRERKERREKVAAGW